MAYVEISLLAGFKPFIPSYSFHHFYVVSPLPFCSYSDTVMILKGLYRVLLYTIQSFVDSFPELLLDFAASASDWGAGSLQVLELTPASPVSTCTRRPPSSRSAVFLNLRFYFTGPLQWHPDKAHQNPACLGLKGEIHTQPGEPRALHPGSCIKAEPQVLSLPDSSFDLSQKFPLKSSPTERSQVWWVWGLDLRAPECGFGGRNIRKNRELAKDSFHGPTVDLQSHILLEWGPELQGFLFTEMVQKESLANWCPSGSCGQW